MAIRLLANCVALGAAGAALAGPPVFTINELDADQPATDGLEFVEIYDGGAGNVSLSGLVLVLFNGNSPNDGAYAAIDLDGHSTGSNGLFVIGSSTVPNVDLVAWVTNGLQNGADAVALYMGNADDFMPDTPPTTQGLLDAVVYGTDDPDDASLIAIFGGPQVNETPGGTTSIGRLPDGSGPFNELESPSPGELNAGPMGVELAVAKNGPLTAAAGQEITYTITISNTGSDAADSVTVTDTLPAGLSFVSESSPPEVVLQDSTPPDLVWTIASVGPGASFQIALVTQVGPGVKGEVVNTAAVETTTPGDDPADNTAQSSAVVLPPLIINEILADPALGPTGDANGDGVASPAQDEFVEIVNNTGDELDMSGWTLGDATAVRHAFPQGTLVPHRCVAVVFGGGSPDSDFGAAVVQVASTGGLSLDNSSDTVILRDAASQVVASYAYGAEAAMDQSITREPDITGPPQLVPHAQAPGSAGALFSPGRRLTAAIFGGCLPVELSELRIDQPSGSNDPDEYFELRGDPGTDLTGLAYLVLGGAGTSSNSGVIDFVLPLAGKTMAADGHFLVVETTFTLLPLFLADHVVAGGTNLFNDANHQTHMLVANFSGAAGQDLDLNNNGTLDFAEAGSSVTPPWTDLLDAVGLIKDTANPPTGTGFAYGASLGFANVGPAGAGLPPHAYRCVPDGAWVVGTLDKFDPDGADTPGTINERNCPAGACCMADGSCLEDTGSAECQDAGGAWQGEGTLCMEVACGVPCPPDVTGDGLVDVQDLVAVVLAWGTSNPEADVNGSGTVDVADLVEVVLGWGVCD
jgi:uncharacterized repeat protein (TIGR01451 family)